MQRESACTSFRVEFLCRSDTILLSNEDARLAAAAHFKESLLRKNQELFDLRAHIAGLQTDFRSRLAEQEKVKDELESHKKILQNLVQRHLAEQATIRAKAEKDLASASRDTEAQKEQTRRIDTKLQTQTERSKALGLNLDELELKVRGRDDLIGTLEARYKELSGSSDKQLAELDFTQVRLSESEGIVTKLKSEVASLSERLVQTSVSDKKCKSEVACLKKSALGASAQKRALEADVKQQTEARIVTTDELAQIRKERDELAASTRLTKVEVGDAQNKLAKLESQLTGSKAQLTTERNLHELQKKANELLKQQLLDTKKKLQDTAKVAEEAETAQRVCKQSLVDSENANKSQERQINE